MALATSPRLNPLVRSADMAVSVLRWRRHVDVVVLHVYSGLAFLSAELLSWEVERLQVPLVMALHGGALADFRERYPARVGRALRRATHLVAPSPFMARHFADLDRPVTVIPNAICLEDYDFRERRQLRPRLLWMRAFSDIYRPFAAIESLAELRVQVPDATLTMAGAPGPLLQETRELATRLGVGDAVDFPGFLDPAGKRRAFHEHDVFLVTTRVDNAPVSVVEAAASGLPVVACDVGGLADLLESGRSGLLVDRPADVAGAVVRLLDNRDLANTLSCRGRLLAETFDWPVVRARWDDLYELVLPAARG